MGHTMADIKLRRARWAVAAMFFVNGFIMGAWAPQIPLLLPRHGITESGLGLLILVLGVGAVGAMLFAGRLIAIYGARRMLTLFSLASVAVLPLVVLAPSLISVALAMALMGAVAGCMDVSMNANAVEVERNMRRSIMSSCHAFWSLGGLLGAGSGVLVKFALQRYAAASVILHLPDGGMLPVGARVAHVESGKQSVVGYDGIAFVEDLQAENHLRVSGGAVSCVVDFPYRHDPARPLPTLGPFVCQPLRGPDS